MSFRALDLSVRYSGADQAALDHVTLEVPRACFYAVLGPNGTALQDSNLTSTRWLSTASTPTLAAPGRRLDCFPCPRCGSARRRPLAAMVTRYGTSLLSLPRFLSFSIRRIRSS